MRTEHTQSLIIAALAACIVALPMFAGEPVPHPPSADVTQPKSDWEIFVGMPAWAAGMTGEVGVEGFAQVAVDVPFKSILDKLEMVGALTLEARHRRWGIILDGMYLRMSGDGETPGRLLTSIDVEVEQVLAEVAVSYRLLEGERGYLDLLAGARYVYLGNELSFHLDSAGVRDLSNDLSNAIVDRAVNAIQGAVSKTAARVQTRLAAVNLNERADVLRAELRTTATEKILEANALRDIINSIHALTPAQRGLIKQKIQGSQEIVAANKALAQAVIQERVTAAVAAARRKAQQAVARAKKQLAGAIESAIRDVVPEHVSASKSWVDPFIGFRGRLNLTDKIYLAARGDIGGFGIGSDLAYNLVGAIGYQWNRKLSTELGYRCLSIDYSDGGFVYDTETSGAFMGLTFRL